MSYLILPINMYMYLYFRVRHKHVSGFTSRSVYVYIITSAVMKSGFHKVVVFLNKVVNILHLIQTIDINYRSFTVMCRAFMHYV